MILPTLSMDAAAGCLWDLIVLGAGPAGSVAARRLALGGARVLLVEKRPFPRSKVCGACLNQEALGVLSAEGLGTLVADQGGLDIGQFHVGLAGRHACFRLPGGKALSRDRFDAALVNEAVASGVEFLPEAHASVESSQADARAVRLDRHGETVTVRARVVIVATGLGHQGAGGESGLTTTVSSNARIGAGCALDVAPDEYAAETIHMAIGRNGYVGLVRVEGGRLNLGAAFDKAFVRDCGSPGSAASKVLAEAGFPAIASLESAHWHGTLPLTQKTRPVAAHRLLVIGDATGYVEPFTGQGMAWALSAARAVAPIAAEGVVRWVPAQERAWVRRHRREIGRRLRLCRALSLAIRRPWIARPVFFLAARLPRFSGAMIGHVNKSQFLIETG